MKNIKYVFLTCLAAICAVPQVCALDRYFDGTERLYIDVYQPYENGTLGDWTADGGVYLHFWKGSGSATSGKAVKVEGNIYYVVVPEGTWSNFIIFRGSSNNTNNLWNKTGDLTIDQPRYSDANNEWKEFENNYISSFRESSNIYIWGRYIPLPYESLSDLAATTLNGIEEIHVCTSAASSEPFTLVPNINSDNTDYDYGNVHNHAWFHSTNGTTWTCVDGMAGERSSIKQKDPVDVQVGAVNSTTYYYLRSRYSGSRKSSRLLKVVVDKNCSVTTEITSLKVAKSAVNVSDTTFVVDGMVAYTQSAGNLIIQYDGVTLYNKAVTNNPETFKLESTATKKLSADGKQHTIKAYFASATSASQTVTLTAPTATTGITEKPAMAYNNKTLPADRKVKITETREGSNAFEWSNAATTLENTITIPNYDTTIVVYFKEFTALPAKNTDLMGNGGFENKSYAYSSIMDYTYAGADLTDIYSQSAYEGKSALMGLVANNEGLGANKYWKRFAKVVPKDGTYMAVFDGDATKPIAWSAKTTDSGNSNLVLRANTTYLFSFWVANVNNFGEMNNPAVLQFFIDYKYTDAAGVEHTVTNKPLGDPIDFSNAKYQNNLWWQNSSSFDYPEQYDATYVKISVKDKNTNGLKTGNDFALDDIRFQAVSSQSSVAKKHVKYTIKYEEPKCTFSSMVFNAVVAECGQTNYSFDKIQLSYDEAKATTITLTDSVGNSETWKKNFAVNLSTNATGITISGADLNKIIPADGKTHTLTARFTKLDGKGVNKGCYIQEQYTAPMPPAIGAFESNESELTYVCEQAAYEWKVTKLEYTNQKGELSFTLDGTNKKTVSYTENSNSKLTLTNPVSFSVPADGKDHTIVAKFAGYDCQKTVTLTKRFLASKITSFTASAPATLACGTQSYDVTLHVEYENVGTGKTLYYEYDDAANVHQTKSINVTGTQKDITINFSDTDDGQSHMVLAYFDTDCQKTATFTSPTAVVWTGNMTGTIGQVSCGATSYSIEGDVQFTHSVGNLVVRYDAAHVATLSNQTATSAHYRIDNMTAVGTGLELEAYFMGKSDCKHPYAFSFDSPTFPTASLVAQAATTALMCGQSTYTINFTPTFAAQTGDMEVMVNGVKQTTISAPVSGKQYQLENMPADAGNIVVSVSFTGANDCKSVAATAFEAPKQPKITKFTYSVPKAECGKDKYTVSGRLEFQNQRGQLQILDENGNDLIVPQTVSSPYEFTTSPLDADGGSHELHVLWSETGCAIDTAQYTAPAQPKINSLTITPTAANCNGEYDMFVVVDAVGQEGTMNIAVNGANQTYTPTGNANEYKIGGLAISSLSSPEVMVSWTGENTCSMQKSYAMPSQPSAYVSNIHTIDPVCGGDTYDLQFDLTVSDQPGTLNLTIDGTAYSPAISGSTYTIAALPIAHSAHNLHIDWGVGSCQIDKAYSEPIVPQMSFDVSEGVAQCSGTYAVSVKNLSLTNQNGIGTVEIDGVVSQTLSYTENSAVAQSIAVNDINVAADGNSHQLRIHFDGSHGCDSIVVLPAKLTPSVAITDITTTKLSCGDISYDLSIVVTAENTAGDMLLTIDGATQTYTKTGSIYTVKSLMSTGKMGREVEISFAENGCSAIATYDEQPIPMLGALTATTTALNCGETQYDLTISVPFENLSGTLTIEDNGKVIISTDTVTTSPFNYTILGLTTDGKSHSLSMTFGVCSAVQDDAYMAPVAPVCQVYRDTICAGERYDKYGFSVASVKVGLDTIIQAFDTLMLVGIDKPMLNIDKMSLGRQCADVGELRIGYSTEYTGDKPTVSAQINATTDVECTLTADTIILTLPTGISGGKYSVTLYTTNGLCDATADFDIELAYTDMLYRKWNDVIFVDNSDSLFVAYQWYHNGKMMDGETRQRLYDPNGLDGLFYCQMTTADGDVRYTCESDFDDIQRSADVSKSEKIISKVLIYTLTGELLQQFDLSADNQNVPQTTTRGAYLIRMVYTDGTTETNKLIVR